MRRARRPARGILRAEMVLGIVSTLPTLEKCFNWIYG